MFHDLIFYNKIRLQHVIKRLLTAYYLPFWLFIIPDANDTTRPNIKAFRQAKRPPHTNIYKYG